VTQGSSRLGPRPLDQAVNGGSGRVVTLVGCVSSLGDLSRQPIQVTKSGVQTLGNTMQAPV
jgi:hypothetical protein